MVNKRTAVRSRSSHGHEIEPLTKMQSIIEDEKEKSLCDKRVPGAVL